MTEPNPPLDPQQVQHTLHDASLSPLRRYATLTTGRPQLLPLFKHELLTGLFGWVPGAAGLAFRSIAYRALFGSVGKGTHIGRNVTIRGAGNIHLGSGVMIDDYCVLDARGAGRIEIGDRTLISRNTILRCRGNAIRIGSHTDIGANCIISTDSDLVIGNEVLIAAYVYVCAGGNHRFDRCDLPILRQGFDKKGGATIGDGAWIGARTSIFDGVEVGQGTIVGAHSMVNRSLPDHMICFGSPAKAVKSRPGF